MTHARGFGTALLAAALAFGGSIARAGDGVSVSIRDDGEPETARTWRSSSTSGRRTGPRSASRFPRRRERPFTCGCRETPEPSCAAPGAAPSRCWRARRRLARSSLPDRAVAKGRDADRDGPRRGRLGRLPSHRRPRPARPSSSTRSTGRSASSRLSGRVTARSQNGPISIRDCGGDIEAAAQNGPIEVGGEGGRLRVQDPERPHRGDALGRRVAGRRPRGQRGQRPRQPGDPGGIPVGRRRRVARALAVPVPGRSLRGSAPHLRRRPQENRVRRGSRPRAALDGERPGLGEGGVGRRRGRGLRAAYFAPG